MVTVINNPASKTDEGGSSFLIGIIVLIGFIMVLLYFGIPAIKNIKVPTPQVVIPDKINVNVQQTK